MLIGTDCIGVTTVYFCHDSKGRFVMAKRSQNARDEQGTWDIGGGKMEFGDSIEDTLKREIWEEYCAEVLGFDFLGFRDVHRTKEGKPTHWIALDFKVRVAPETVRIGEPHKFDEIGWFTLDSLPRPLHSQLPVFFEKYKKIL